jgi:ribosome-interacting GTPase 1
MGILEKISDVEKEIARTQKNKGKLVNDTSFRLVSVFDDV